MSGDDSRTTMQMPLIPRNFTLKYLRGYILFYVYFTTIKKKVKQF